MLVDADERGTVESVLDGYDVDHVWVTASGEDRDRLVVEFPLPTQALESVLDDLRASREDEEYYTVVTSAETAVTPHVDELEDRFVTGTEADDSIATEEIRSTALDLTPSPRIYYAMTLLSALVATAGLLLDSPAVVVGSMVIAPLVGSALTASVGTVLGERSMAVDGLRAQALGLALAVVGAAAFSAALRAAAFLPPALDVSTTQQIAARISPGLLSLVVGVCAGAAGAFGLATGVSVALVGVMIAAALVPAAAAVGIGLAWGIPAIAGGALLMLLLNAVAIHVSGAAVLWALGYRAVDPRPAGVTPRRVVAVGASAVVLVAVLGGTGAVVGTHVGFEREVNRASADVVAAERYPALELVAVRTEFAVSPPLSGDRSQQVTVVVTRPSDRPYPALSEAIGTAVTAETGREVTVVVEFVDQQTYAPGDGSAQRDVPTASLRGPAAAPVPSPAAAVGHTGTFRVDRTPDFGLVGP
jgi:uncharacterized hydrophobic protein (TIGR00271 family)